MILDAVRAPRSSRVVIDIPVRVLLTREKGAPLEEVTKTVLVNARGALITLRESVAAGERLRIFNVRTNAAIECTVASVRASAKNKGIVEVGVAFDEPRPRFWGLSFPPDDWQLVDRKRPADSPIPS
jgi:hypothetical protein